MTKNTKNIELQIAQFLRVGVIVSGLLIFIGWMGSIKLSTNIFQSYEIYNHEPLISTLSNVKINQWPHLIIYAGLICLISLPFFRVLLTGFLFIKQRDYLMASLVLVVFIGLIISISQGIEL